MAEGARLSRLALRWRLAIASSALVALLAAALGAGIYIQVGRLLQASVRDRLLGAAPLLAAQVQPQDLNAIGQGTNALEGLNERLRQSNAISHAEIQVSVLGPQGQAAGSAAQSRADGLPLAGGVQAVAQPPADMLSQAARLGFSCRVTAGAGAGSGLTCVVPLGPPDRDEPGARTAAGQPLGYLVLQSSLLGVDATLARLRLALLLGLAGTLVLAALLSVPLARVVLGPLSLMALTAERIGEGDLSQRVAVPPARDEVRDLALAFNHMLARIEAAFAVQRASEVRARQFAADASHELRSPLTALSGSVDVLLMGAATEPSELQRVLHGMQREIRRVTRLVQDLLLLARLDAVGAALPETSPLWVKDLVVAAVRDARSTAGGRSLVLDVRPEAAGAWVSGDDEQLRRVLLNLLDNAVRHTADDGWIEVSVRAAPAGRIAIAVQDDGVGIAPEHLPHIFDRFYRADPSRDRETGNAGLGLAIARRGAEAHGGTLTAESIPGRGSCFTLTLPLLPEPPTRGG